VDLTPQEKGLIEGWKHLQDASGKIAWSGEKMEIAPGMWIPASGAAAAEVGLRIRTI